MGLNFNQGPLSSDAPTEGKDGADHSSGISFPPLVPSAQMPMKLKEQIIYGVNASDVDAE